MGTDGHCKRLFSELNDWMVIIFIVISSQSNMLFHVGLVAVGVSTPLKIDQLIKCGYVFVLCVDYSWIWSQYFPNRISATKFCNHCSDWMSPIDSSKIWLHSYSLVEKKMDEQIQREATVQNLKKQDNKYAWFFRHFYLYRFFFILNHRNPKML